ncbi:MAG: glutathione S-transferase N-terminal domain-containing protein [Chromatiales bacterium]|nr:glutathione S-transferase N-terminal domain-containing protein [Chromatiales bacterium]
MRNLSELTSTVRNRFFGPNPSRSAQDQNRVDQATAQLTLYQFGSCPYCIRVRRAISRLQLNIVCKDTLGDMQAHSELLQGGGSSQVPCLRIDGPDGDCHWLYESADIVAYLEERFPMPATQHDYEPELSNSRS